MCLCPQAVCQYDLMSLNNNIVKWQNVFGASKSLIVWIKALIKGTLSCHFIGVSYIIDAIFKSGSSVSSLYFPELRMKYGYTVVSALSLDTLHVYFFSLKGNRHCVFSATCAFVKLKCHCSLKGVITGKLLFAPWTLKWFPEKMEGDIITSSPSLIFLLV